MRCKPSVVALAFAKAVKDGKKSEGVLIKNFIQFLYRHRLLGKIKRMIAEIENVLVRENNGRRIILETAGPLSKDLLHDVKKKFHHSDLVRKKINPRLVAGLKITIDDETVIDGSLARKLKKLFKS